jgi:hypothetical protein
MISGLYPKILSFFISVIQKLESLQFYCQLTCLRYIFLPNIVLTVTPSPKVSQFADTGVYQVQFMKKVGPTSRIEFDGTWYLEAHPKICDFFKEAGCFTYCEKLQSFHQQGKQRLLYNLLDEMQSVLSQAAVFLLDADQLLEKRVRLRFSHRKILFSPPFVEDLQRLLEHALLLPTDSNFPHGA